MFTGKNKNRKKKKQLKSAYRYSGLALQMIVTVVAFVLAGRWLDKTLNPDKSYFAFGLGVFSTIAVHIYLIRQVLKSNKKN